MWPPLAALLPLGEALREKMLGAKLGSDSRPEGGLVSFCKSASLGEKKKKILRLYFIFVEEVRILKLAS
jgi:hypothetical protein